MPRPPAQPARESVSPHDLADFDRVVDRFKGEENITPYFGALLNSPPFCAALAALGTLVRKAGDQPNSYSHTDREFADQVLAVALKTNVVMKRHIPDALAVGIRPEAIEALRAGRDDDLTDGEGLLARYICQVASGTVSDECYAAMEKRLGVRGVVEYTIFIAFLVLIMRLYQAFGLPDPSDAEIAILLREYQDGTRDLPDYRLRIR